MGYINAAFAHHGYQVSIAQFVGDVPADIQQDNFLVNFDAPRAPRGMKIRAHSGSVVARRRSDGRASFWWEIPVVQTGLAGGHGPKNGASSP